MHPFDPIAFPEGAILQTLASHRSSALLPSTIQVFTREVDCRSMDMMTS